MHADTTNPPFRSRWARVALGAGWLALGAAFPLASGSDAPPDPIRVMTYNIRHGVGADGALDLARIARTINDAHPHLVALQEVDKGVARTQRRDLPAELAALTGMEAVFSNNFSFQGGEYGNAILTRFPVVRWTNTHLAMIRSGEQRGVLQVLLSVPARTDPTAPGALPADQQTAGRPLWFLNTHIDFRPDDAERLRNVAEFKGLLAGFEDVPTIFCGDFNDVPESRTHRTMSEVFSDAWRAVGEGPGPTYPSTGPARRIDYVWFLPSRGLEPVRAWTVASEASDHVPLVAEFRWTRKPPRSRD